MPLIGWSSGSVLQGGNRIQGHHSQAVGAPAGQQHQPISKQRSGPGAPCANPARHTGSILALTAIRGSTAAAGDSSGACFTVLASGSSDTTIKLWDIAKLQQLPPAAAAGAAASKRHRSLKRSNSTGPAVGRHQGYTSLLATLRGHSGPVTSLLRWDEDAVAGAFNSRGTRSSLSSGCGLLSTSRDHRVKLWDVAEGRQACVATWRLPGPCDGVVDGLYLPGSVVVRMPSSLQVGGPSYPRMPYTFAGY